MKKLIYILSIAAVASLTVLSCQKEQEVNPRTPSPAEVAGCYGVYFPVQEASGDHVFNPTQDPELEITVARTNDSGAITVPVTTTFSEEGIFVPQEIKFADGQKETTFKVRFDNAKEGVNYKASFTIEDNQYASLYNSNPVSFDFSILRVQMVTLKEEDGAKDAVVTITVNNDFLGDFGHEEKFFEITGTVQYYEVDNVRYAELIPIEHPIWFSDAVLKFNWYTKAEYTVGEKVYQPIEVPSMYTGYDLDGSEVGEDHPCPVYAKDYYHYWTDRGNNLGTFLDFVDNYSASYPVGYYDGHGGFYFNLIYTIEGTTYWYGYCEDSVVAIASGYSRVDYTLKIESDYPYNGQTPIFIEAGVDVENLKYAIYEGELTKTQIENKVAAITDGSEETTDFSEFELDEDEGIKYATLNVSPETTGLYTLVAVAFDKDKKAQNSASVGFNFVSADDQAEYEVEVSVFTEDTPARYASYHKYDSFAYGIAGEDLTDVHMAIFKYDDVVKNPDAYFDAVKIDAKGSYAVSEETLAEINGEGGYYTVATGMPAKTQLMIIVWATNGDMESWVYDTYTTDKLPYVWNSLGKGTLTDGFFVSLFSRPDYTVACDVYEEATTPGLYMITNYQLPLVAQFFGITEEEMLPYEGGNWKVTELVIDATNPEAVFIDDQDYGVCVNSAYGFVLIGADPVGTLADGAITFPAKTMYAGLGGTWYYGNTAGTFKITLPSVGLAAPAISPASAGGNVKTNFVMARDAKVYEKPVMVFERNPQPVKASVKVVYTRKEVGKATKTIAKSKATAELR